MSCLLFIICFWQGWGGKKKEHLKHLHADTLLLMSPISLGMTVRVLQVFLSLVYFLFFFLSFLKRAWRRESVCRGESVQVEVFFTVIFCYLIGIIYGARLTRCDAAYMWQKAHAEKAQGYQECDETATRTLSERERFEADAAILCERPIKRAASQCSTRKRDTSECFHGNRIDYFIPGFRLWSHQSSLCSASHVYALTNKSIQNLHTFSMDIIKKSEIHLSTKWGKVKDS